MKAVNELWLGELDSAKIEYVSANLMYTDVLDGREFDAIWCTGVLSHNPEQLRMIKKLHDLLCPDGVLVLESATIRRSRLRRESCVEIIYPSSERIERKYHLSQTSHTCPRPALSPPTLPRSRSGFRPADTISSAGTRGMSSGRRCRWW